MADIVLTWDMVNDFCDKYGEVTFLDSDSAGTAAVVSSEYRGYIGSILATDEGYSVLGAPMVSGIERRIILANFKGEQL